MVGMQHFNLRWNNYTSNILQVFSEHLASESLVDVTLSCQGRFVKAHKIILSACSPYFQEVFANHTDKHPVIILKGIKYEDLQSMIKFMYNGEIRVQEALLDDLLAAAELLQVKGLSNVRSKYERGEITSTLNHPGSKPVAVKCTDTGVAVKELVAEQTTKTSSTTRVANTIALASSPVPITGPRVISPNDPMTRIPASTFHAANIGIATFVPGSTIIPVAKATRTYRNIAPATTTAALLSLPSSTSTIITNATTAAAAAAAAAAATTATTASAISTNATIGTSIISSTCTTPSLNTPIITCVTGNFVDPSDNGDPPLVACDPVPIVQQFRLPSIYTCATTETENKVTANVQPARARKRRKMSHIVNELAKETVFASNGTVLLEPDDAISKKQTTTNNSSTSLCTEGPDASAEVEEITVKKMRVKIQTKNPQESLLIKEKMKKKNTTKIPRPPNAFMIFANEWRRKLAVEYPQENNKKISVRLGVMWKGLSIKAKETYYKLAKKADEEHKQRYPGYYYSPKEARLRKTLKHDLMITKSLPTTSKPSSKSQNSDGLKMLKTFVNGDDREIVEFTDSSEYDDDDGDNNDYEDCEEVYDDDVIVDEYSEDEDQSRDKSRNTFKSEGSATPSNKCNSSKT